MKVYIVGHSGADSNSIDIIHKTYEGALKAWNKIRVGLLERAKYFLKQEKHSKEMWQRMVNNLSCEDPEKIDNFPHDTPYITECDVEE